MKTCLLVIDVQESFRHRPYYTEANVPAYLEAQNALIAGCVAAGLPVVRVFHTDGPDEPDNAFAPSSGLISPMEGLVNFEVAATFIKHRHSALVGTGLDVTVGSYAAATILAPDNTALSDDLVTYLLSPGREALARTITRYNIIPKLSTHLMAAQEQEGRLAVTTLHGLKIDLQVEANNIVLAGTTARLLAFSLTSQGIVYRSDRLLLPPEARIYVPSTFRPPSRVEIPPLSRLEFPMVLPTTP